MKVREFVEVVEKNKSKLLKAEQLQVLLKKELDIKEYIGIKTKKQLVQDIVNECLYYEDGVFKFDDIQKYICFTMRTIAVYTNLEMSEDIEDDYDVLCESKLLDVIISTFKKEYDDVNILLQMKCDYVLSDNNIESQVGKFLTSISEKLDEISGALVDKIDGFSLDKLPIDQADLIKILNFVNKQQK